MDFRRRIDSFKDAYLHIACKHFSEKHLVRLLKQYGVLKGDSLAIKRNVRIDHYKYLIIGNNCAINGGVRFYIEGSMGSKITLMDNVVVARDVIFETGTHEIGPSNRRVGNTSTSKSICVEDGVWIGVGSIILPGVTIGHGCVIAAGSVIVKDCEPNCIYGGNPAKIIKRL